MSSVSPFLISVFAAIRGLGLLPSVFRLGFGFGFGFGFFFFVFFGVFVARGFAIICWACHMLFFSLDWFCFLICCLGLMLGFGQQACSITFFFSSDFSLIFFFGFYFLLESRTNKFFIFYLRVFLILLKGVPIFF